MPIGNQTRSTANGIFSANPLFKKDD